MRIPLLALLAALTLTPAMAQTAPPYTPAPAPGVSTPPATPPANGRPQQRRRMRERFEAANTTRDGKLTLDQAKAANMVRIVRNFDAIDSQRRGYVTMEDIRTYSRAQRAARRAAQPAK